MKGTRQLRIADGGLAKGNGKERGENRMRSGKKTMLVAGFFILLVGTIPGDFNLVSRKEVEALAGGDGSGRVQR